MSVDQAFPSWLHAVPANGMCKHSFSVVLRRAHVVDKVGYRAACWYAPAERFARVELVPHVLSPRFVQRLLCVLRVCVRGTALRPPFVVHHKMPSGTNLLHGCCAYQARGLLPRCSSAAAIIVPNRRICVHSFVRWQRSRCARTTNSPAAVCIARRVVPQSQHWGTRAPVFL